MTSTDNMSGGDLKGLSKLCCRIRLFMPYSEMESILNQFVTIAKQPRVFGKYDLLQSRVREIREHGSFRGFNLKIRNLL